MDLSKKRGRTSKVSSHSPQNDTRVLLRACEAMERMPLSTLGIPWDVLAVGTVEDPCPETSVFNLVRPGGTKRRAGAGARLSRAPARSLACGCPLAGEAGLPGSDPRQSCLCVRQGRCVTPEMTVPDWQRRFLINSFISFDLDWNNIVPVI